VRSGARPLRTDGRARYVCALGARLLITDRAGCVYTLGARLLALGKVRYPRLRFTEQVLMVANIHVVVAKSHDL